MNENYASPDDDDSLPWVLKLQASTSLPEARSFIERAGRERRDVLIRVLRDGADPHKLSVITADALERNVTITIKSQPE